MSSSQHFADSSSLPAAQQDQGTSGETDDRNPFDGRDDLDSYHIVPVVLSEIAALKELLDNSFHGYNAESEAVLARAGGTNSGAVLLLRCSDESFDTVMKSLEQQDIQLAICMLEQQIALEEQTEDSLTHLTQLYRKTSTEKFLNTAHALMKSQQRLAWIRSRILRCMSKHLLIASSGQIEARMEPLLKRVLRFPDLAYKYVPSEDIEACASRPVATATVTSNGEASREERSTTPVRTAQRHSTIEEEEAIPAASEESQDTPTQDQDGATPQPSEMRLSPLVGLLMTRLDQEGVSSRQSNELSRDSTVEPFRSTSVSPPPVPVNSRSTPGGENEMYRDMSMQSDVFPASLAQPAEDKPLSSFVTSLFGKSPSPTSEQEEDAVDGKETEVATSSQVVVRTRSRGKMERQDIVEPLKSEISLLPPEPPRRSSSYEVLKKLSEKARSTSRTSSNGSRSPRTHSCSPATSSTPSDDVLPAGFGSSHHLSSLLHDSSFVNNESQRNNETGGGDVICDVIERRESSPLLSKDDQETQLKPVDSGAVIDDDIIGDEDGTIPQFVGNLSSLMSSRITFA